MKKIKKKQEIIYITYDGIMEPLGESQVLSYLELISKYYKINLISFEKKEDLNNKNKLKIFNKRLNNKKICWIKRRYYKSPKIISTIYSVITGMIISFYFLIVKKIKIIHIRSYIPGLMIIFYKNFFKFKLIFDMRGFWPEEKIDRIGWKKNSFMYFFFKKIEKKLFKISDSIICLTSESADIIKASNLYINKYKFIVIPTCVDTNKFNNLKRIYRKKSKKILFGYLGTIDKAYNIDRVLKIFYNMLKFNNKLILKIFYNDINNIVYQKFKNYKIPKENYSIKFVKRNFLSKELNEIDIGIFFLNENYSVKASFPTKIAEFLSCGKPIFCNNFNKDITSLIKKNKIGIINNFKNHNYNKIYNDINRLLIDKKLNARCRNIAEKKLSLKKGVQSYLQLYNNIIN